MRYTLIALAVTALAAGCANQPAKAPANEAPSAAPANPIVLDFADANTMSNKGSIGHSDYSEKADDRKMEANRLEGGNLVMSGQVGLGKGSQWAGIGVQLPVGPNDAKVDASAYKTVTFNLASATSGTLRLRLMGEEAEVRNAGCYPIVMQAVTEKMNAITLDIAKFAPEGWCGPKARNIAQTMKGFTGVEVADSTMQKKPTTILIGKVTLQ